LFGITFNWGQIWLYSFFALNVFTPQAVAGKSQDVVEYRVDVNCPEVWWPRTREIKEVREKAIEPSAFARDDIHAFRVLRL
jgi:hypothetical protein